MKSLHSEEFNHDQWASEYDKDVLNESHPIREGYGRVLDWVIQEANIGINSNVLELGSGTGNLTRRIKKCKRIVCVDISTEMDLVAARKTKHLEKEFRTKDILEAFESETECYDAIISTYAIHHLTEPEKYQLFGKIWRSLSSGGISVFGDLMVEDEEKKKERIEFYRDQDFGEVSTAIEEEFFWHIDGCLRELKRIGFDTEIVKFSDLSFGISAKKTEPIDDRDDHY